MEGRGHSTLLFDREVAVILLRRVLDLRRAALAGAKQPLSPNLGFGLVLA